MTRDNKKSPAMAWASLTRAAPLTTKSASRSPHSVQRNNRAHRERAFRQICPHCHGDARNTENKAKRANIGHIEAVSRRHNPGTVTSASPPHHQPRLSGQDRGSWVAKPSRTPALFESEKILCKNSCASRSKDALRSSFRSPKLNRARPSLLASL
jgi:hypothetical protein